MYLGGVDGRVEDKYVQDKLHEVLRELIKVLIKGDEIYLADRYGGFM